MIQISSTRIDIIRQNFTGLDAEDFPVKDFIAMTDTKEAVVCNKVQIVAPTGDIGVASRQRYEKERRGHTWIRS